MFSGNLSDVSSDEGETNDEGLFRYVTWNVGDKWVMLVTYLAILSPKMLYLIIFRDQLSVEVWCLLPPWRKCTYSNEQIFVLELSSSRLHICILLHHSWPVCNKRMASKSIVKSELKSRGHPTYNKLNSEKIQNFHS